MPSKNVFSDLSGHSLSESIGNQPIGKLLFRFSLPGVISMLVGATYNVVDTIYVGKLGHEAIAALTVVFPIQLIIVAASAGVGIGAASLISCRYHRHLTAAYNTGAGGDRAIQAPWTEGLVDCSPSGRPGCIHGGSDLGRLSDVSTEDAILGR